MLLFVLISSVFYMVLKFYRNLLLGLACNESTSDIELDISCNNLGSQGAHVLESCIHGVRCIGSLDISENSKYFFK